MDLCYNRTDYEFALPPALIAQAPASDRDGSRMMVSRGSSQPQHRHFRDLGDYLRRGDVLVLNRTRVMKARCLAKRATGGRVEVFVLGIQTDPTAVPVLLRPAKKVREGDVLTFPNAGLDVRVARKLADGKAELNFGNLERVLSAIEADGHVPLPPYIKREDGSADHDRYQTVYADELGAVAAPTAGLHFTESLLEALRNQGVETHFVTHHVGIGTFKPLTAEDVRDHEMETERYSLPEITASALNAAKDEGRRIIAVGTTSTRCLEANFDGRFHAQAGQTGLYIMPGYRFRAINGLITNFHLPGSSLILLVAALMGRERILSLYQEAIDQGYRFYSYGDAMLLFPSGEEI